MNKPKGFSLIELLVVIAIIGLLSTMAVVSLNNARVKARDTRRMGDIKALQTAIEIYKTQQATDTAPQAPATWAALGTTLSSVMTSLPTDPTNADPYAYIYCWDTTNQYRYLVAAAMEQTIDIPGDIDAAPAGLTACIGSTGAAVTYANVNCTDSASGRVSFAAGKYAFCLGQG